MKHDEDLAERAAALIDAQDLRRAARIMRIRGWSRSGNGPYWRVCLMQAIALARGYDRESWGAQEPPQALLQLLSRGRWKACLCVERPQQIVTHFNDTRCDSKREAIVMLKIAADLAESLAENTRARELA